RFAGTKDGLTSASWASYITDFPWSLSSGCGIKTLYAQFRDYAGNISQNDLSATTTLVNPINLVPNDDMEAGNGSPSQWIIYGNQLDPTLYPAWSTVAPHSGNRCIKIGNTSGADAACYINDIPVTVPGKTFVFGGWGKVESMSGGGNAGLMFAVTFSDGTTQYYLPPELVFSKGAADLNIWKERSSMVTFDKPVNSVRPYGIIYSGHGASGNAPGEGGIASFDDIYVYGITDPGISIPAAPSAIAGTGISTNQINLTWVDRSNNETGFKIERSPWFGTPAWSQIAVLGPNATSYADTSMTSNAPYQYRMRSYNAAGNSAYVTSGEVDPLPPAPSAFIAGSITGSSMVLSWVDNSSIETEYRLERSTDNATWSMTVLPADTRTYSASGLNSNTNYYFRVCARNAAGNSAYATLGPIKTLAVAPAAPTALTATTIASTYIVLTWSDNSGNEDGFKVERSADNSNWVPLVTLGSNVTRRSDSSLTPYTAYYYRICAYNAIGNSGYAYSGMIRTLDTIPAVPLNFSGTAISGNQITLTFRAGSANTTGFNVYRAGALIGTAANAAGSTSAVTYSDSGLTPSTSYSYTVSATNSGGESAQQSAVQVTTQAATTALVVPVGLSAAPTAGSGSTSVTVTFRAGSSTTTGFRIFRWNGSSFAYLAAVGNPANSTAPVSYINAGLSPNTTYYYTVSATNGAGGESAQTNYVSVTTMAGTVTLPAAPTKLAGTAVTKNSVRLTWQDNSNNETGFKILYYNNGIWSPITTIAANSTFYTISGLTPGTGRYYSVYATNAAGDTAASAPTYVYVVTPMT
ncbi:MAG: fibronectin type III domain-containing protein, partial [Candidatus Omnitrophota bacterium]